MIVAVGDTLSTDCSPSPFVRGDIRWLFGSAPMALMWMTFAPTSSATAATFSAPFHCTASNWVTEPRRMPTSETTVVASWSTGRRLEISVTSTDADDRPFGITLDSWDCRFDGFLDASTILIPGLDTANAWAMYVPISILIKAQLRLLWSKYLRNQLHILPPYETWLSSRCEDLPAREIDIQ